MVPFAIFRSLCLLAVFSYRLVMHFRISAVAIEDAGPLEKWKNMVFQHSLSIVVKRRRFALHSLTTSAVTFPRICFSPFAA